MQTEHIFVVWSCIRIKGEVTHEQNWLEPPPPSPLPLAPTQTQHTKPQKHKYRTAAEEPPWNGHWENHCVQSSFPNDCSKAVPLLQFNFLCLSFHTWRLFCHLSYF